MKKILAFAIAAPALALVLFCAPHAHASTIGTVSITPVSYGPGDTSVTISTTTINFISSGTWHITGIRFHVFNTGGNCDGISFLAGTGTQTLINGVHRALPFSNSATVGDNDLTFTSSFYLSGSSATFYHHTTGVANVSTWYAPNHTCEITSVSLLTDTPVPVITIESPDNGENVAGDFPFWSVFYGDDGASSITTSTPGKVRVLHGRSPSTMAILDERPVYSPDTFISDLDITHSNIDGDGVWYAQAILTDYATSTYYGAELARSPVISYTVGDVTGGTPEERCRANGEENNTSTGVVATFFGAVRRGVCEAGIFLFSPSQEALDEWSDAKDTISNKPPFGYYTAISVGFSGVSTGTTSTVIMSASTTAALAPLFGQIRTGLAFLILVLAGFWLYHRFSLMSLHG